MWTILKSVCVGTILALMATLVSAQSEYRVRSGDILNIEVLEDAALNRAVQVLPDGRFSFPFGGTIRASGRTVGQIEAAIVSAISSNFAVPPNVFVSVTPEKREPSAPAEPETIAIYFMGEVNKPGLVEVAPGTTLLQAVTQSGGLTKFAATKRIQLRRNTRGGGQSVVIFNYKALSDGAMMRTDPRLYDGDVIVVPERRLFE